MIEVSREQGESLLIGDRISVEVIEIDGDEVLLRIEGIDEEDIKYLDDDPALHAVIA